MSSLSVIVLSAAGSMCLVTAGIGVILGWWTLFSRDRGRRFWGGLLVLWWVCALSAAYGILVHDVVTAVAGLFLWAAGLPVVYVFGRGS